MDIFAQVLLGVTLFFMFSPKCYVECQTPSTQDPFCLDNSTCPCCINTSCPTDGSGQCGGNCNHGYHGGKCYNRCPHNCIRCVDAQQGGGVSNCTMCKDGFYSTLSLYQCQTACSSNCKTCVSKENCTLCREGFYFTESMYQCQPECSSNCKTCKSNASRCTSCHDGYYLTDTQQCNRCNSINPTCATCNSQNNCTSCIVGYYLNLNDASCNKCDSICYSCNTSQSCSCYNGCSENSINGSVCKSGTHECNYGCRPNFTSKNAYAFLCDICISTKYGVECDLNCSPNCKGGKCERQVGNCFDCTEGFYGDKCEKNCPTNCPYCNKNSSKCVSCRDGFYGINCTQTCATHCIRCEQINGTCTSCNNGFYGVNCTQPCPGNCKEGCTISNGQCVSCKTGLTGENCKSPFASTTVVAYVIPGDSSKFLAPAVGGTLSAVLVIVIVIVIAVFLFRRRSASTFRGNFNVINLDDYNLTGTDVLEENDEFDSTYFTCRKVDKKKPCGKLAVKELAQFVDSCGEEFYQEEFLKLPRGLIKPCEDAQLETNIIKNRYIRIYPYDEHRVKLLPPGSDFINASYIDGFKTKKEYIATLGPTRKSMEDFNLFWRMIWQEKTDVIVMVTNLMEEKDMKCEQYWPEVGCSLRYGDVIVRSHSIDVYAEFVIRNMTISVGIENRTLNHLHYTAWPDKRVPDDVSSLIEFRQKVKASESSLGGPIVVHCSSGIGRTGTYLALDILINQGKAQKYLDIFEWVTKMREQRTSMVQTWKQYMFLHRALVHALTFRCEPIKQSNFLQFMESLNDKRLKTLFKQLTKPEPPPCGEDDARKRNKRYEELNREGADIPGSLNRPALHLEKMFGECNYINAVYINSYKVKDRFLVCQTPLPDTVKDFITLIIQESCSCIVSMDPPGLRDDTIGEYFSRTNIETFSHSSYICEAEIQELDKISSYILRKLTIQHNHGMGSTTKTVYHYQFQHWPQGNHVPDVSNFLQLVQDVDTMADMDSGHGPVLVHCLNAAERSGLFCAVSNLIQKMRVEGEVSVVNTLRQVKVRRPLAIPNKEQYQFCYHALRQFLTWKVSASGTAIYCNV